jgi:hypothetical protein
MKISITHSLKFKKFIGQKSILYSICRTTTFEIEIKSGNNMPGFQILKVAKYQNEIKIAFQNIYSDLSIHYFGPFQISLEAILKVAPASKS